jgi:GNAT superfamily N-acetyltransferase
MDKQISYRSATMQDVNKLSILFKQVYIQTYGTEGVSDEFANFIMVQFSPQRIEALIKSDPRSLLVACYKNNLVGVAEISFNKRCPLGNLQAAELNKLYILEWFCAQGIGENLLKRAEQIVLESGGIDMWLWVLESNQRAIRFYKKHQFMYIGKADFKMETHTYMNDVMIKKIVTDLA